MTLTSFICSISDGTRADPGNTDHLSLLKQLPPSLWAKSLTNIGKIHSTPPIKVQTDSSKPLLQINRYLLSNKAALQGIKSLTDYKAQGLIIPCTSFCNTPILLVRKPKGRGWGFV